MRSRWAPATAATPLFLGRMCPDKGVHVAVAGRPGRGHPLADRRQDARAGRARRTSRTRVQPLLGDGVEYLGEVGGRDKLALLAGATCLLNPMRWPEPFGMVMIEALACGTPVVATPCGSVPEIIDDGVTGFVRESHEGLVAALGEVAGLDRNACRKVASDRFSSSRMVAQHLDLYRSIARSDDPALRMQPA